MSERIIATKGVQSTIPKFKATISIYQKKHFTQLHVKTLEPGKNTLKMVLRVITLSQLNTLIEMSLVVESKALN